MANSGKDYEKFVQDLMNAIVNSEKIAGQKNIAVEHNKILKDRCGLDRQFDIYWEYSMGGFTYKNVIECKDYDSAIPLEKVDALVGKLSDFSGIRGIFATKTGYQSGAKVKAEAHAIDLLLARKLSKKDFTDNNGKPLIRDILVRLIGLQPAEIIRFDVVLDADWIKKHTDFDSQNLPSFKCQNNTTFIEDIARKEKYSLMDLQSNLDGEYEKELENTKYFSNAFITYSDGMKLKLKEYKVRYIKHKPLEQNFEIDAMDIFLGVVEYISTGTKKMVSKDGKVKNVL